LTVSFLLGDGEKYYYCTIFSEKGGISFMKSEEKLKESYLNQKKIFEEAEARRIENAKKQKEQLEIKRKNLAIKIQELEQRINNPKTFESFDSFRQKSETLSNQSKRA
jgi:acyl-CoA hydrolase